MSGGGVEAVGVGVGGLAVVGVLVHFPGDLLIDFDVPFGLGHLT